MARKKPTQSLVDPATLRIVQGIAVTDTDGSTVRLGPGDDATLAPAHTNWQALLDVGAVEKE